MFRKWNKVSSSDLNRTQPVEKIRRSKWTHYLTVFSVNQHASRIWDPAICCAAIWTVVHHMSLTHFLQPMLAILKPSCLTSKALTTFKMEYFRKRKTNTIWYHLYVDSKAWHLSTKAMNLSTKQKQAHMQNRLVVAKGRKREGVGWTESLERYKLLHSEWIDNEVLLFSTGINHDGKEY